MDDTKMSALPVAIGLVVLVGIGAAAYAYSNSQKNEAMMEKDAIEKSGKAMKENGAMMEKDATKEDGAMMQQDVMLEKGTYESYGAEKLARADKGDVVLFFRAGWCPTCRALDADIRANAGAIPAGLTILDVNYDSETALKKKYGVTYQHTFVQVAYDGSMIATWKGSPTLTALVAQVK